MSEFKTALLVQVPLDGGDRELFEELIYHSDLVQSDIIAPKGMTTNYGSVPKILHNVLSPTGKPTYGFVIHDHLYEIGTYSKRISDGILNEAMKVLGVGWFKRSIIMSGLKIGGFVAWNKHRKKDK